MRISISFDFYANGDDGRTDYSEKRSVNDFLTLSSLVTATYFPAAGRFGFKPPPNANLGTWRSTSKYIGKETSGKYYITHIDFPDPGKWAELENPVGLFFDSSSDSEPFLTLYRFWPTGEGVRWDGAKGELDNKGPIPMHSWLDWYRNQS